MTLRTHLQFKFTGLALLSFVLLTGCGLNLNSGGPMYYEGDKNLKNTEDASKTKKTGGSDSNSNHGNNDSSNKNNTNRPSDNSSSGRRKPLTRFDFRIQGSEGGSAYPCLNKPLVNYTSPVINADDRISVKFDLASWGSIDGDHNPFFFRCVVLRVKLSNGQSKRIFVSAGEPFGSGFCEKATEDAQAVFSLPQGHGPLTVTVEAESYDNCRNQYSLQPGCRLNWVCSTHQINGTMLIDTNSNSTRNDASDVY